MHTDKFIMKRAALTILTKCNLNCKHCSAYSPYLRNTKQPSLEEILKYTDRFFDIVDFVEIFSVSGGEPLLFKQLPEVINALSKYRDRIEKLEIITNGTIVPSVDLINSIRKLGDVFYRFLVDDYGEYLSIKISEIDQTLKEAKLPYEIRNNTIINPHSNGWIDYGLAQKIHTSEEAIELFDKCSMPHKLKYCFGILNGIFTPCPIVKYRLYLGQDVDRNDYIDLMDDTMTVEQQRQKILNIYNTKVLESCMYCKGMCDDSARFTPAEQLTPDEIRQIKLNYSKGKNE